MSSHWVRCAALIAFLLVSTISTTTVGMAAVEASTSAEGALQISVGHTMGSKLIVWVTNVTAVRRDAILFLEIRTAAGATRRFVPISVPGYSTITVELEIGMPYTDILVGIVEGPDPIPR